MELVEFNILVMPAKKPSGWIVSCPALGHACGSGDTVFEAIADWQGKIIVDAANEFVRARMKR